MRTWLGVGAILAVLLVVVLFVWLRPWLLWAYNLEQAGRLMEQGMDWPEERGLDALPRQRDEPALDDALGHLAAAMRWRPEHAAAPQRAGEIYLARKAWLQAAESFETARRWAPRNPHLALRTSLAYEQLALIVEQASRRLILNELAASSVETPALPIDTAFCEAGTPQSCYVGLTNIEASSMAPDDARMAEGLFLHPPAQVSLRWTVESGMPVLAFALGLDPRALDWGSDGATFEIRIEDSAGSTTSVYERTLDHTALAERWTRDSVDLSAWAGQSITLAFQTTGGPAGDTTADWTIWGDVAFTSVEAAAAAQSQPHLRMAEALEAAHLSAYVLLERSAEAARNQREDEADRWYRRAVLLDPSLRQDEPE